MSQRALQSTQNPRGDPTYAQYPCVLPGLRVQRYPHQPRRCHQDDKEGYRTRCVPLPCCWFTRWLWSAVGALGTSSNCAWMLFPGCWLGTPPGESLWHWASYYPKHRARHSRPKSQAAPLDGPVGGHPTTQGP